METKILAELRTSAMPRYDLISALSKEEKYDRLVLLFNIWARMYEKQATPRKIAAATLLASGIASGAGIYISNIVLATTGAIGIISAAAIGIYKSINVRSEYTNATARCFNRFIEELDHVMIDEAPSDDESSPSNG
jgi:hypothetical protein